MASTLAVVIATAGRKELVARLLTRLAAQRSLPDEIVLSAIDRADLPEGSWPTLRITSVIGKPGSSAQRIAGIAQALGQFDILTFMDDDFVPAHDYLSVVRTAFDSNPGWAVVMGHVVRDGVRTGGLEWDEAIRILETDRGAPRKGRIVDHIGAYGCNMSVRASIIGDMRFDERLVLYGWQEDIDFTSRLRQRGRLVCLHDLRGVHLGFRKGRVSGKRFGYSQVANPIYLVMKGSVPASFALPLMFRNIASNVVRSVKPEPHVDRRGRLQGNLMALRHVAMGRVEPEFILKI